MNNTNLRFWDLGGQEELHSIWEKYYRDAHGVIFVVDSTDTRLELILKTLESVVQCDLLDGVPMLLLANKQDVEFAMSVENIQKSFNKIAVLLDAKDSKALPCVATTGAGVKEAVEWLFLRMQRNKDNPPK